MHLSLAKTALWAGSLGVFGWLGYELYDYKARELELLTPLVTAQDQKDAIEGGRGPQQVLADSLVDYSRVQANFHNLNWTGKKPPPPPPPRPPEEAQRGRNVKPIDQLLSVLYIQVDSTDPEDSLALARPLDPQLAPPGELFIRLSEGETLPDPYFYWKVDGIDSEGVRFAYLREDDEDPEREPEWARPPTPIEGTIVEVGEGGVVMKPAPARPIPERPAGTYSVQRPDRTIEIGLNEFRLGEEDMRLIGENYLDILSNEVRTRNYRNPDTGQWEGIEITSIAPGSIASQHGAMEGDVVISVNGHAVNSVNEAITFAKNNSDVYSTWNVVVMNAGIERTITYETD